MKIKGHLFTLKPSGIQESSYESDSSQKDLLSHLSIFCDVLSVDDRGKLLSPEDNTALASLIELWIRESLEKHATTFIDEEVLSSALKYANHRLLQSDHPELERFAISAVIIAPTESSTLSHDPFHRKSKSNHDILIVGIGDCRVYQIKSHKADLIFCDPLNQNSEIELSAEDRLYSLHNAIGLNQTIDIHCERISFDTFQQYALVSYGFYQRVKEQEILEIGLNPKKFQYDTYKHLNQNTPDNNQKIQVISFGTLKTTKTQSHLISSGDTSSTPSRKIHITLAIASTAVVLGIASLFFLNNPSYLPLQSYKDHSFSSQQRTSQNDKRKKTDLISSLRNQILQHTRKIDLLAKELHNKEQQLQEITSKITPHKDNEFEQEFATLHTQLNEKNILIKELSVVEEQLQDNLNSSEQKIAYLENNITKLEEVLNSKNEKQTEDSNHFQDKLRIVEQESKNLLTTIEEKDASIIHLTQAVENYSQYTTTKDELTKAADEAETARNALATELQDLKEAYQNELSKNKNLTQKLAFLEEISDKLDKNNAILQSTFKDVKAKESIIASLHQELDKLMHSNEILYHDYDLLLQLKEQQEEKTKTFEAKYIQEQHKKTENDQVFTQLKKVLKQQQTLLSKSEDSRSQLLNEADQLKREIAKKSLPIKGDSSHIHLIADGETLSQISMQYYGTTKKWEQIYEANRKAITNVNRIKVGTSLIIP